MPHEKDVWFPEHVPDVAEALEKALIHPQIYPKKALLWCKVLKQDWNDYVRRYKQHCTRKGTGKQEWFDFGESSEDEESVGEMEEDSKPAAKEDGNPTGKSHNNVGSVMGDNLQRPIGSKKAKRARLLEEMETGSIQSSKAMETVAGNSGRMAAAIEKRQRHDSWYKRADLFLRMGDTANAQLMIQKMEDDDIKVAAAAPDPSVDGIPRSITVGNEEENKQPESEPEQADPNPTFRSVIDNCLDSGDDGDESSHPSQPSDDSRLFAK